MELIHGVHPMTDQDIEQVVDLEQVCFSESWSENLVRMGPDSRLDTYFVYADHGAVLGYAVVRVLAGGREIQQIRVYPNYRHQGIMRELMDVMVAFARARGVRAIALEVRGGDLGAKKLYNSYGLKQRAVRKGYYHDPAEDAVIMQNRII